MLEADFVKQTFEDAGYLFLYDKFSYQFYVTGLFELVGQQLMIERFLDSYNFDEQHPLFFDDFSFFFKCFHYSYQKKEFLSCLQPEWDENT